MILAKNTKIGVKLTPEKIDGFKKLNQIALCVLPVIFNEIEIISELIKQNLIGDYKLLWDIAVFRNKTEIIELLITNKIPIPDTTFVVTANEGNIPLLERLYKERGVHQVNYYPLIYAARSGHLEAVKFLIEKSHCDPTGCSDDYKINLLHAAILSGNTALIEYALGFKQALINEPNFKGITPLCFAIIKGDYALIRKLIAEHGTVVDEMSITTAVKEGKLETLQLCLGDPPYDLGKKYEPLNGGILLHLACHYGHNSIIRWLLDYESPINSTNDVDFTPLMHAIQFNGNKETIELLLEKIIFK